MRLATIALGVAVAVVLELAFALSFRDPDALARSKERHRVGGVLGEYLGGAIRIADRAHLSTAPSVASLFIKTYAARRARGGQAMCSWKP